MEPLPAVLQFHAHTPKHGSWLNIAENELSSLTRQCVSGRRVGVLASLQSEIAAWSRDVNTTQRGVDWQMKISDARCKLKSLYRWDRAIDFQLRARAGAIHRASAHK